MKYSKYFGTKRRGFIKSESNLAPKGASHFKTENIRCDTSKGSLQPCLKISVQDGRVCDFFYKLLLTTAVEGFMIQALGGSIIKLITAVIYGFCNKIECLSINTKLCWKGLPGSNTLAYYGNRKLQP